jgi:hypothetical protein
MENAFDVFSADGADLQFGCTLFAGYSVTTGGETSRHSMLHAHTTLRCHAEALALSHWDSIATSLHTCHNTNITFIII